MREIVVTQGQGTKIPYLGSEIRLKVAAKETGGLLSALEMWVPAGSRGPSPHVHYAHDESWYVLEGEFTTSLNGHEQVVSSGSFVFVPRGVTHTHTNSSGKLVKLLCFFTPARYERCYEEIAQAFPDGAPDDIDSLLPIMAKYDTEPSGTATILFVDIANSTALTEKMGDAQFRKQARELDAGLRSSIREGAGMPIEGRLVGDGLMAIFASAHAAIEAALRCREIGDRAGLPLHLGLHAGDVIQEEGNVYGGAVNVASRISGLSAAGELLVSDIVRGLARTSAGVAFEDRGERALKGVGEAVRVWAVVSQRMENG
jgi:class 3 adenylate cyclase/quercetin dioxygenase-like cupin family protein